MSKVAVVYWSGTGNTEAMANRVAEGAQNAGAEVALFTAAEFSADKMMPLTPWLSAARPWELNNWRKANLSPCSRTARRS